MVNLSMGWFYDGRLLRKSYFTGNRLVDGRMGGYVPHFSPVGWYPIEDYKDMNYKNVYWIVNKTTGTSDLNLLLNDN